MWTGDTGVKRTGLFGVLGGDEYEVVPVTPSWGTLSIALFLVALLVRPILRLFIYWTPDQPYLLPLMVGLSTPAVGLVGLLFGVIGWRRSPSKVAARVGMFLNGTVVGLTTLLIVSFYVTRYLR